MEPRAAQPAKRLEAVAGLAAANVPVAVLIGPVIPGLNDSEIPRILAAAAEAGACSAAWVLLRLAKPIDELFIRWLGEHFPDRKQRVLHRIQDTRAGRLNDTAFGRRKRGQGEYATQIAALFESAARKHGLHHPLPPLSAAAFRRPAAPGDQLKLL
jgi:DNA repair photolyase